MNIFHMFVSWSYFWTYILHIYKQRINEIIGREGETIFKAIYIAVDLPSQCRQESSHILNILGDALDNGVTIFFSSTSSFPLDINYTYLPLSGVIA